MTVELRSPAFDSLDWRCLIQGLAFLDRGRGWREGEGSQSLTGAGVGARFSFGETGSARIDVGWPLGGGEGAEIHAGVLFSF